MCVYVKSYSCTSKFLLINKTSIQFQHEDDRGNLISWNKIMRKREREEEVGVMCGCFFTIKINKIYIIKRNCFLQEIK